MFLVTGKIAYVNFKLLYFVGNLTVFVMRLVVLFPPMDGPWSLLQGITQESYMD